MKKEETEIDGFKYEVTLMGADEALDTVTELLNVIGPALMGDPDMVKNLNSSTLKSLAKRFAKHTKVYDLNSDNPDRPLALHNNWSNHFSGEYDRMFQWVFFCVQVNNFKGFLSGLQNAATSLQSLETDLQSKSQDGSETNG